jgi:hypothetical protein
MPESQGNEIHRNKSIGGLRKSKEREIDGQKTCIQFAPKNDPEHHDGLEDHPHHSVATSGVDCAPWSAEHCEPTMDMRLLAGVYTDCVGLAHREFELQVSK